MNFNFKSIKGNVTINGQDYVGRSIIINGDKIVIDGETQIQNLVGPVKVLINGDVETLSTTSGDVTVEGNVGKVSTTSGDVGCRGNIDGSVNTTSGDVSCHNVYSSVNTISGDISRER